MEVRGFTLGRERHKTVHKVRIMDLQASRTKGQPIPTSEQMRHMCAVARLALCAYLATNRLWGAPL